MSIIIKKKIKADTGIYIELECDGDSKRRLKEYVKQTIDPDSKYDDFHTTLIYSKKPFDGEINLEIGKDLNKVYAKPIGFKKFINEKENIYAIVIELKCIVCEIAHKELMKKYKFKYDYDKYIPHITLTYNGKDIDIDSLPLPNFMIKFDKINIEPLDENWVDKTDKK